MSKSTIRDIIYILIFLAVLILGIRFIVWIFPVLILLILGYYIYRSIKINRTIRNMHNTTNNKNKTNNECFFHTFTYVNLQNIVLQIPKSDRNNEILL